MTTSISDSWVLSDRHLPVHVLDLFQHVARGHLVKMNAISVIKVTPVISRVDRVSMIFNCIPIDVDVSFLSLSDEEIHTILVRDVACKLTHIDKDMDDVSHLCFGDRTFDIVVVEGVRYSMRNGRAPPAERREGGDRGGGAR